MDPLTSVQRPLVSRRLTVLYTWHVKVFNLLACDKSINNNNKNNNNVLHAEHSADDY